MSKSFKNRLLAREAVITCQPASDKWTASSSDGVGFDPEDKKLSTRKTDFFKAEPVVQRESQAKGAAAEV